ncbi:MAG: phosphate acetyltransferase, partial [Muribaculaceae bacterium]|nr:phosphate acetyltransferase [Muribaculaceae bacterium]
LSGAGAGGPLLQGLAAPVNDLSRGATVEDIINTIIVTCNQSLSEKK